MNENELLNRLFRIDEGMLWELTMDNEVYRHFGAAGKYPYLWPLRYNANNDTYVMYSKNKGTDINRKEAESRAHEIRDEILFLVNIVDTIKTFDSIIDYETLEKRTARVSFAKFAWSLKYLQMIYPEVLPQMYADHTIDRALKIDRKSVV